jgi:hypothetical protein
VYAPSEIRVPIGQLNSKNTAHNVNGLAPRVVWPDEDNKALGAIFQSVCSARIATIERLSSSWLFRKRQGRCHRESAIGKLGPDSRSPGGPAKVAMRYGRMDLPEDIIMHVKVNGSSLLRRGHRVRRQCAVCGADSRWRGLRERCHRTFDQAGRANTRSLSVLTHHLSHRIVPCTSTHTQPRPPWAPAGLSRAPTRPPIMKARTAAALIALRFASTATAGPRRDVTTPAAASSSSPSFRPSQWCNIVRSAIIVLGRLFWPCSFTGIRISE